MPDASITFAYLNKLVKFLRDDNNRGIELTCKFAAHINTLAKVVTEGNTWDAANGGDDNGAFVLRNITPVILGIPQRFRVTISRCTACGHKLENNPEPCILTPRYEGYFSARGEVAELTFGKTTIPIYYVRHDYRLVNS